MTVHCRCNTQYKGRKKSVIISSMSICFSPQVLDDSTENDVSAGMEKCVAQWQSRGVDIRFRHRAVREGYKAGNLREGLSEPYALTCEYVAVLDADFEPTPDWLQQTVPVLQVGGGGALLSKQ